MATSRCRYGKRCRHVRIGQCEYYHEECPNGYNCPELTKLDCEFYHPPAHFELRKCKQYNKGWQRENAKKDATIHELTNASIKRRCTAIKEKLTAIHEKTNQNRYQAQIMNLKSHLNRDYDKIASLLKEIDQLKAERKQNNAKMTKLKLQTNNRQLHSLSEDQLLEEQGKALNRAHAIGKELRKRRANKKCVICMDSEREVFLQPCGHMIMCRACYNRLDERPLCPVCQIPIRHAHKVLL